MDTAKDLLITCKIGIQKPVAEIFAAIVQRDGLTPFFLESSSDGITPGATLLWKWPEFDETGTIRINEVCKNERISFTWQNGERETKVSIRFEPFDNGTLITVTEGAMPCDEQGLKWLAGNTEGWANFLACLKAWMEHGINLRHGAFDFLKPT